MLSRQRTREGPDQPPRLGLRANLAQFSLLVGVNALVGGMVGQERAVLPLLAKDVFFLDGVASALTFIVAFGIVKAISNFVAGTLMDKVGRKPILVAGWLAGIPVPLLLLWAPSWTWVIVANIFLGLNQGFSWSATVVMKIDIVGPRRRGTAMGFNEAAGYGAMALTAMATGWVAQQAGLRTAPFLFGLVFAGLGLAVSTLFIRETHDHAREEGRASDPDGHAAGMSGRQVFILTSIGDRALSAACQAGFVNNLNDGVAWGVFPLFFASKGSSIATIGALAAIYPAVWGVGQLFTGALSDRWGRKRLIAGGMMVQSVGIALIPSTDAFAMWAVASALLGAGTAMAYPSLLAAVVDVSHPRWRASSVGIYRLWRDAGFAVGALASGLLADAFGMPWAIIAVAMLTAASGVMVLVRMYETHPASRRRRDATV